MTLSTARLLAAGLAGCGMLYASVRHVLPYRPVLERVRIPLPSEHQALAGFRIAFVSDIHAGPFFDASDAAKALALFAGETFDLILLGGDFVSESPRHLDQLLPVLGRFASTARLGAYGILGNHDYFVSAQHVVDSLERIGIRTLVNESVRVNAGSSELVVVGLDDTLHGRPDTVKAFSGVGREEPVIALWHEPAFAGQIDRWSPLVQLSGHTHGGQVRIPGLKPMWLPKHSGDAISGLQKIDEVNVYTSRGVGVYRPPVRFRCPPEVTLIELMCDGTWFSSLQSPAEMR
jgi:predicted MPP superfamily phosphohydrolase